MKKYLAKENAPLPGLDSGMEQREAQLSPTIPSLGACFRMEEREGACKAFISTCKVVRERAQAKERGMDERKEGISCAGRLLYRV